MGDAQSAQREGKKDAATEESTKVDDDQPKENIEDKLLQNNGQISEINGKADDSIGAVNGDCEDEIAAEAILSPAEDISETEKPLTEEETPLGNFEINEMESTQKTDDNEDVLQEMIQLDEKQNDINEGFRRFFGNIGLKLTVKRGSGEIPPDMTDENNKDEPNRPEDIEDMANEPGSENAEQNYDNDSTTCPTLTDATSDDALEDAGEKTTETKVEEESFNAHADTTSHEGEEAHQDMPEEEPHLTPQSSFKEEVVASPLKRFFTTGIFSGMRKKKKSAEDETKTEKELVNMGKGEVEETTEKTGHQQDKDEIIQGVEAAVIETEHKEDELKEETQFPASAQTTDEGKPPTTDRSTIIVLDSEILNSQEKDKVQASPLRRLLSGSSLKKLSKKRRGSRSSDGKLSDSGEHVSDHLLSSTESAENQKEEGPAQPSVQAAREEDSAWTSFKKLLTPKRRIKRPSLANDETEIPVTVEEPKPSEGEQISDHSTEEGKKRKDSSVSWEAVLCGSGKRRSRKTSDSEDETPQNDNCNKEDIGPKHSVDSQQEISNENDILASSPKQAESPSEGDGESTWKSLKRLVTPKRKSKDEDESKENIKSDSELSQDESSFSIKRLLPGRKKRKSNEKPDLVSSDEADKDVPSEDEDSETPAVVPLSEFDTVETDVHIQTQADVESQIHDEGVNEVDQMAEAVLPCDSMQTDATKVQDDDEALRKQISIIPATNEDPDELSESISKQQQLSDIPEEGIITETMATPASVPDEAARDDTIADDYIEITSEAITAPEPVDITLTDDTEMISAVSQLSSESSKTSGNTTPVPAEYDVKETDVLLQQVVETISTSPKAVQVYSEELSYDKISDTCLNVEELDTVNALSATAQTESLSELNDSVSTEIISEVLTEEFNSAAEITLDEVHKVKVSHLEESVKELQSTYEEHHLIESVSEVDADISPEGNKIVLDEGSTVARIADETKYVAKEEQVQTLEEKEDQIMQHITDQIQAEENDELPKDQIQAEDKDEPPKEEEELQEIAAGQAYSEEASVQSIEKEVISENIPAAKTILYELKEESVVLTDVTTESEKKEELQTDPSEELEVVQSSTLDSEEGSVQSLERVTKDIPGVEIYELKEESVNAEPEKKEELQTDPTAVQAPEELEAVQASKLDSEECSVRLLEREVISENIAEANTVVYEIKEESLLLTDVDTEPEKNEELQTAVKTEEVKPPEEFETLQASTLDLEEARVPSLEKVIQDIPAVETAVNELKEERVLLTDVDTEPEKNEELQTAGKTEEVQPPEEFETLQASILDLEEARVQFLEKVIQDIPAVDEKVIQDIPAVETVVNELKEDSVFLTDVDTEPEKTEELQTDQKAAETEEVCSPEEFQALQASTLDSEVSVQSLGKEVISENIPSAETAVTELKEECVLLTDVDTEPEQNEELQTAGKTEEVQAPEEFETRQASTLDLEEARVQFLEKVIQDIPAVETVVNKLKEESVFLTDVDTEPEKTKELQTDQKAAETEEVCSPEEFEALQASTLHSEGSVQSLGKEVISENIPSAETAVTELKEESVLLTDVDTEPEQNEELQTAGKTEEVQAPKEFETLQASILDSEGSFQSLEKEVISENIPAAETVVNELKDGSVLLTDVDTVDTVSSVETVSDEHKQETEVSVEPEEKIPVEAAKTELSITDESETKVVTQPDQTFEITEDQKTESIPQDHLVEQEDNITEVVEELKILTADHVSVNEEASYIQVIETTVFSEETPAPCVDNAAFTDEPKHKGNLCEGQENVEIEVERELPGTEIKTASVEYAVVEQLVTCNIKEVSAAIPDVLIEKTSSICEALIEEVASEGVFKEEDNSFTPSVRDDVAETAEEGVVVMVMQVPSVELKENHRIQVQVVNFDIQSAETIVDKVLEIGVTDTQEVIHVCHATVKVDNLSSTPEIEEELMIEEKKVVIKEVSQHVKENIPETVAESVVVNLEQEVTKQPDVVTEVSEFVESESNHSTGTTLYEVPAVISDNSATEQQMSEDLKQTPDLPETLEAQIHDQKEDLEETKAECEISELRVTAEEVKLSSEELNVKEMNEQAQITEIAQSQSVTSSNTGLIVPQNTGMISSIGTVESPSSISLEFKLNIQFAQAKAPDCPQPTAERIETVKPMEMAEVGVQAVEVVEPVKLITPTQRAESQKEAQLTKVVVWATEIIEPAANISTDSTEEVVTAKPIMLDVCTQAINTRELEEQILSTERVTSSVQATETIQLVMQAEERAVFQSQQVLSVAFDQGEKAAEPVKQLEEETDQDVWMDAEEVIYTQGETEESHLEVAEPLKPHTESEQEEKVGLEQEVEMAPNPSTYEDESQQDMHKTDGQIGIESESEDFAVAPEHTDTASSSITSTEWD